MHQARAKERLYDIANVGTQILEDHARDILLGVNAAGDVLLAGVACNPKDVGLRSFSRTLFGDCTKEGVVAEGRMIRGDQRMKGVVTARAAHDDTAFVGIDRENTGNRETLFDQHTHVADAGRDMRRDERPPGTKGVDGVDGAPGRDVDAVDLSENCKAVIPQGVGLGTGFLREVGGLEEFLAVEDSGQLREIFIGGHVQETGERDIGWRSEAKGKELLLRRLDGGVLKRDGSGETTTKGRITGLHGCRSMVRCRWWALGKRRTELGRRVGRRQRWRGRHVDRATAKSGDGGRCSRSRTGRDRRSVERSVETGRNIGSRRDKGGRRWRGNINNSGFGGFASVFIGK